MMKNWFLMVIALCAFINTSQAQGNRIEVSGNVLDNADHSPVIQATIQLLSPTDQKMIVGNVSDTKGHFTLNAKPGKYLLKVSFVGYKAIERELTLSRNKPTVNLGNLLLKSDAILLEGATVVAQAAEVTAKGDTLEYNSSAFRVPEGSSLEALVKKLPGAQVDENGKITINGKEVKKIMVDGKEFFANDPNIAMKNLPVDIIDRIKAYDKQSDLARVTGIDDGEEETVLDLRVKKGMNQGWFGNINLGVGNKNRYGGKMMLNRFYEANQFTIMGSANNVNDNGFDGVGPRWWQPNGLNANKNIGFNFATKSEKLETGGSVNFNYKDADISQKSASESFVTTQISSFGRALAAQRNKNMNVNGDLRFEWTPDTLTNILFRPQFSYGNTKNTSINNSYTFSDDPLVSIDQLISGVQPNASIYINQFTNSTYQKQKNYSLGGNIQINRQLGKRKGRNITFRGNYNYSRNDQDNLSSSDGIYFQKKILNSLGVLEDSTSYIRRYNTIPTRNTDYSTRLMYSEPLGKQWFLQMSYNFQYRRSQTDNQAFNIQDRSWNVFDPVPPMSSMLRDSTLSKFAKYDYYNHRIDLQLRWITEVLRLNAGLSFQPQNTRLSYKRNKLDTITRRSVFNFTPTFDLRYTFSKTSQLRINYRGRTSQPSMTDLLDITDNTNPMYIRKGNPGLKPTFTNEFNAFYNTFDPEKQRGIMTNLRFQNSTNSVTSRTSYDPQTGARITQPDNINGNWNAFGMFGTNTALRDKRFTINTFTMGNYNNIMSYVTDKGLADAQKNRTNQLGLIQRLRGTFRNDWLELSLNGGITYSHSTNQLQPNNNMDTYQFSYGGSTNINLPWNMTISTDLTESSRRGYTDPQMNRNELVWNAQIAQNFLKGNAATVSIQFYDILKSQSNISRAISAAMRQDTEYNSIFNYCMVHFIYRLNLFGKGVRPPMDNDGHGFGGPRGRFRGRG